MIRPRDFTGEIGSGQEGWLGGSQDVLRVCVFGDKSTSPRVIAVVHVWLTK